MNKFLSLSESQRKRVFEETAARVHLPAQAIEKDFWVTEILNILFLLQYADKMVFKGGTSLSKVWGVIRRFSEDIDIAVDRSLFGFEGNVTKKQLKKLRKASSVFVRNVLSDDLKKAVKKDGLDRFVTITPEPDGEGDATYPEPREISIKYASVLPSENYLRDEILLEVGARSLFEPTACAKVSSFIAEIFSNVVPYHSEVKVIAALAEKTFLEKVFLLHELFSSGRCENANRKSRHLYDLCRMFDVGIAKRAVLNTELWETIGQHRAVFTPIREVDYTQDFRKSLCLTPPDRILEQWRADYDSMVFNMIYEEDAPSFDTIIEGVKAIEDLFRRS